MSERLDNVLVVDIAVLAEIGHEDMVLDQEGDAFLVVLGHADSAADAPGEADALVDVHIAPGLAQVMEQDCHDKHVGVR